MSAVGARLRVERVGEFIEGADDTREPLGFASGGWCRERFFERSERLEVMSRAVSACLANARSTSRPATHYRSLRPVAAGGGHLSDGVTSYELSIPDGPVTVVARYRMVRAMAVGLRHPRDRHVQGVLRLATPSARRRSCGQDSVVARAGQPEEGDERSLLRGWLTFYRDAVAAKCAGLSDEQLISQSAAPSSLSLLGLVRHLSEMERVYLHFALRGGNLELRYCAADPEADIENVTVEDVAPSMAAWREDCRVSDGLLAHTTLEATAPGDGMTVRWNLLKVLGEYARHAGHADIIRERIDGMTGE